MIGSLLTTISSADHSYEFANVFNLNVFEDYEAQNLKVLLAKLNATNLDKINVNMTYKKYKYVTIKSIKIDHSTSKKNSVVIAIWNKEVFGEIALAQTANPIDTYQVQF